MKLGNLLILTTAALIAVGYVEQLPKNQAVVNASVLPSVSAEKAVNQAVIAQNVAILSGAFVSGEHKTQGAVRITTKAGKSILELGQSFKTSTSGPDLVVILHRADNVLASTQAPSYPLNKHDYVIIAPLQKYSGNQSYTIPNNINLADYKSVAILCRKYNATFGAAKLNS